MLSSSSLSHARQGGSPVPAKAGIGLKPEHYGDLLERSPTLAFLELHPENYMGAGGPPHRWLTAIAEAYPLSFHGVGLSLGGTGDLDAEHLERWKSLHERYQPALVSEHIAWSGFAGMTFHDLLPLPYTEEALETLTRHIGQMQDALKRQILVENPSQYLPLAHSPIPEPEFLTEVARRSGCGLLIDVNNVYVSARNLGFDAAAWLDAIPTSLVGEIHLAGHAVQNHGGETLLIDDHGSRVSEAVWRLYQYFVANIGPKPTLIEWDTDIPPLDTLLQEAAKADQAAAAAAAQEKAYA